MRKAEIYAIIATLVVLVMMLIITLDSDINPYLNKRLLRRLFSPA